MSSTFSKILELHILDVVSNHKFEDVQFGFIEHRGTSMATALTHDVADYFNTRGSTVYACALDAEGACDAIPHPVIFDKLSSIINILYWRLLYFWYSNLIVTIRWENCLSEYFPITRGTRQGGLSSPFLFNVFYQDMIKILQATNSGLKINDMKPNCFCYADDILLTSATASGLQNLINLANIYIVDHGLRFNPEKTECIALGKSKFSISLHLNNVPLKVVSKLKYLGVYVSGTSGADHSDSRVMAARKAFYSLQAAGLCLRTDIAIHTYKTAVRPILTYGCEAIKLSKNSLNNLEKCQAAMIKSVVGIKKSCRNTPLLAALGVCKIKTTLDIQQLLLLKKMFVSTSITSRFYNHLLALYLYNKDSCEKSLLSRVATECARQNVSNFLLYLFCVCLKILSLFAMF